LTVEPNEVNGKRDGLSVIGIGAPEWQTQIALSLSESWLGDFGLQVARSDRETALCDRAWGRPDRRAEP
jgi:hypothetical protein